MKRWSSYEWIVGKGGWMSAWGGSCWILGFVFAVLGIIAEVMNTTLGLEPISWFLLAIAAFVAGISWYIGWAVAVYLEAIKAKEKE
jgi:hypothetical protein